MDSKILAMQEFTIQSAGLVHANIVNIGLGMRAAAFEQSHRDEAVRFYFLAVSLPDLPTVVLLDLVQGRRVFTLNGDVGIISAKRVSK